ncbi:hypothetical protein CH63R_06208 [Colletotrichum higginsianum IMI 349063]|uniref:Uncharacterized protein n=1 Tax=Colletotrichum higginsianum (strain IMI 349063) TaxID=759273 RepID=A0A1B7YES7_COLHI|nr:hypothetical protein CH63R_06208 [Colletotrichum higginsianum IMI 349063]OBR10516.1 hypothetical protein CH63R_06208 [Colletotrichum higginsianum IMI 349063]
MAPTPSERAQAKFFAVLEDPRRYDSTSPLPRTMTPYRNEADTCETDFKNRVMITRTPSGGSELTNVVSHPPPRRASSSSQGSVDDHHRIRNRIKNWMYRPAI